MFELSFLWDVAFWIDVVTHVQLDESMFIAYMLCIYTKNIQVRLGEPEE